MPRPSKIHYRTLKEAQITEEFNRLKGVRYVPDEEFLDKNEDPYRTERMRIVNAKIALIRGTITSDEYLEERFRAERQRKIGEAKARELGFL